MNYFEGDGTAKRYAQSRPYFHPQVIELVRKQLSLEKVPDALDVACGTGQSTQALLAIADKVTGTDASESMLAVARQTLEADFIFAPAEQQPFADESFNIITTCMAFHWLDQTAFLGEARRLLKPNGALVIYNSGFPGIMANNESFTREMRAFYDENPAPKRAAHHPSQRDAAKAGFVGEKQTFEFWQAWALPQLIAYLCTQSNVISRVDRNEMSMAQMEGEIAQLFRRYFSQPTEQFLFQGDVSILKIER